MKEFDDLHFLLILNYYLSGMCTGDFQENDSSNSGNGLQRPPAGTKCTSNCHYDLGRWGSSWCYTDNANVQWGAECVECGSQTKPNPGKELLKK